MTFDVKWKKDQKLDYIAQALDVVVETLKAPGINAALQEIARKIDAAADSAEAAKQKLDTIGS